MNADSMCSAPSWLVIVMVTWNLRETPAQEEGYEMQVSGRATPTAPPAETRINPNATAEAIRERPSARGETSFMDCRKYRRFGPNA